MRIVLLEPFFTGSHQQWAEQLQQHSLHQIELLTLPGRHWKWRMHGAAITLAEKFMALDYTPDLVVATDMLDLTTFLGLVRTRLNNVPVALYFHENQLTYPWSPTDQDTRLKRDNHYSFINYTSALAADKVFFNSAYHRNSFLDALTKFLPQFPDFQNLDSIQQLQAKAAVLPLGLDLIPLLAKPSATPEVPVVLWNHRWEYDKNPELFFNTLFKLADEGIAFKLIVLGESYKQSPPIFEQAKVKLSERILHFGYAKSKEEYYHWLSCASILPVTSRQDFFGISAVEAIAAGVYPLLPHRLAFTEHLHSDFPELYYQTDNDFEKRLRAWLLNPAYANRQAIREKMGKYNWENCIEAYDLTLSSVQAHQS